MARTSIISDAIRIEDEVWQEAFETRFPPARRRIVEVTPEPRPAPEWRAAPERRPSHPPVAAAPVAPLAPVRRTVTIRGRGAEGHLPWPGDTLDASRRRPPRTLHERAGLRPDRVAMWAVFLGLLLVFVAAVSSHA